MQLLKKLSTKTVFGGKAKIQQLVLGDAEKPGNKPLHFLYRVYGEARGFVSGSSRFSDRDEPSEWHALAGEFEAVNADGEVFNGSICFLPAYVTGPIIEALKGEDAKAVQFGFDISAQYDDKAATSYIYLAEMLRKAGETSPLQSMRDGFKALPGTKAAPQIEGPKEGKNKR